MNLSSTQRSRDDWQRGALSKLDPQHTALLVIDLQRDFCSDNGALAVLGSDVSPCRDVADRVTQFLSKVRGTLGLVAFFKLIYDPSQMSESQRERLIREGKPVICAPGSWGAELFITPDSDDWVFTKHRYGAFSNERFRQLLQEHAISTIVVVGVDTHICVEGTVRQGYDLGYRVLVLSDLVATRRADFALHENSLTLCKRYFALILDSSEFLKLVDKTKALTSENEVG